ncbi:MAG: EAL domain-containing protein [Treponemataceae bacterium]|nr:EAL domain-containing protein [Treponemataceae bacterium]
MSKKKELSAKNLIFITCIAIAALLAVIAVSFSLYFLTTSSMKKQTAQLRLELNDSIVSAVEKKFDSNFMFLTFAQRIVDENFSNTSIPLNRIFPALEKALKKTSEDFGIENVVILNKDANIFLTGQKTGLESQSFFQEALEGKKTISSLTKSPVSGNDVFLFCAPIFQTGKTIGVLIAEESLSSVEEILKSSNTFSSKSFIRLSDEMGNYLATSDNFELNGAKSVLEDIENMWDDVEKGRAILRDARINNKTGYVLHKRDGVMYMNIYTPIKYNRWFVCSAIPENAFSKKRVINAIVMVTISLLLSAAMIGALGYIAIIQLKYQKKLHYLAYTDSLTGKGNYKWFLDESERIVEENPKTKYAIVSINIIHFKLYNKQFGRMKGDEKLISVFQNLEDCLRDEEIMARANADNYRLLMKYEDDVNLIVERLKAASIEINQSELDIKGKNPYLITLCAGVCPVDELAENGKMEKLDILSCCDRSSIAMNGAKPVLESFLQCGIFNEDDLIAMNSQKVIENRMRTALKDEEFIVYLQPKYSLKENKILGAEALVRWETPSRGTEMPGSFIPIFESNGFILDLDLFVFEKVCHMIRAWLDRGIDPILISVNLSRAYLNNLSFIESFEAIRKKYDVPPKYIELEITETAVIENTSILTDIVNVIHKLGYFCSIDDFGSGYSSLNLLKEIPVDTIKLDKGFFSGKNAGSLQSATIVRSVINLAKDLDMKTVSEGIEDEKQVAFLKDAKCDMIQGFFFSKPIPTTEFEKMAFGLVISEQTQLSNMNIDEFDMEEDNFGSFNNNDFPAADQLFNGQD